MERVAFLIEDTNERLTCLLNPETLVVRRTAGIRSRRSLGGQITGTGLSDDALIYTGGGRTEMELDLLFDVTLAGSTVTTEDVRELTLPLWNLAENNTSNQGYGELRRIRFLWGKYWDFPGIIVAVAERLEHFTPEGAPRRSWLRMRLLRVDDGAAASSSAQSTEAAAMTLGELPDDFTDSEEEWDVYETLGTGDGGSGERLDQLADDYYGDPSLWRLIAKANDVEDPNEISSGTALQFPPLDLLNKF